jgi:hypothetical protein
LERTSSHLEMSCSQKNPLSGLTEEELQLLADKIRRSEISSLSSDEREQLSKVDRLMAHIHEVWSPFWEDGEEASAPRELSLHSSGKGIGRIDLERVSHLRVEMIALRNLVVPSNQPLVAPSPSPLSYQVFGALLGYVVMMRSTGGGWREIPSTTAQTPSSISDPSLPDSPISCLELLLQSTPLIDRSFRPLSVSQTVAEWMAHSSHSLPPPSSSDGSSRGRRAQAVKALLMDVCQIISQRELLLYCLLDLWLLGAVSLLHLSLSSELMDPTLKQQIRELSSIACWPPTAETPIAKIVGSLLTQSPPRSPQRGEGWRGVAELYTRKVAYLLSYHLARSYSGDESIDGWRERLFLESQLYVAECL